MTFKRNKIIFLSMVIYVLIVMPKVFANNSPQNQLKESFDNLLIILKNPNFKKDENKEKRRQALSHAIFSKFNFEKMSQLCLGRHWKTKSKEEKKEFINLFRQLLEITYISKIEGYTDEKIVVVKEMIRKKRAQVNTELITQTMKIPINYRLYKSLNDTWLIYDVIVEGVSLVGNYRSQFSQILQKRKKNSFEKLLKNIKSKIEN